MIASRLRGDDVNVDDLRDGARGFDVLYIKCRDRGERETWPF